MMEDKARTCHIKGMKKYTCPHCGAVYEVTYTHISQRDRDTEDCEVCRKRMHSWSGSSIPHFRLVERPSAESDGDVSND
jgi:transcription elongation factor Elf1